MLRRLFRSLFGVRPVRQEAPDTGSVMLHIGSDWSVTGESFYQPALLRAAGRLGPDGPRDDRRHHIASIEREPTNKHDPDAVRVILNGKTVGYIPRERTHAYHPFLDWASAQGLAVVTRANLVGGHRLDDGTKSHLGIYLNHINPPAMQYDGDLPTITNPDPLDSGGWGNIDITGEQHHQELLTAHRFKVNIAELAVGAEGSIQVTFEGQDVGQLTPKMSDRYRPGLAKHIATKGTATVFAHIKTGKNKLEMTVILPANDALAAWESET